MYATNGRNAYADNSIITANPGKLLTMLYDRLVLDLQRSETALTTGATEQAHTTITHAQDIIIELRSTLKTDVWAGAAGLSALYSWWLTELVGANIRKDAARVAAVRSQVEPLRDAWHKAAAAAPALASA